MPSWYGIHKNEEIEAIWAYIRATVDKRASNGESLQSRTDRGASSALSGV